MISIVCPSRGRPDLCVAMLRSVAETAERAEVVIGLDTDDPALDRYRAALAEAKLPITVVVGDRIPVPQWNNKLSLRTSGAHLMMGNDDLVFRTPGWDAMLMERAAVYPDGIVGFWPDDGSPRSAERCSFPIVSRKVYDTLGYIAWPGFRYFAADAWLSDVMRRAGRLIRAPDILIEHLHPAFGKRKADKTFRDRRKAGDWEFDHGVMTRGAAQRVADAEKLKVQMI